MPAGQIDHGNPEVHLSCGITDPQRWRICRSGRAALHTGRDARHGFWTDMLAPIFSGPDDPNYGVLEIVPYYIEYVTGPEPEVWRAE
jgi:general stress protein 26